MAIARSSVPTKIPMPPSPNVQNTQSGQFVSGTPTWAQPLITAAATKYGIPTAILSALLKQESGFQPNVVSSAGAQGIAQFMPGTASSYGINPFDPRQAIDAAGKYLRSSLNTFGGDISKALASYNAGVGAVQQYNGVPPYAETQNYVKNILAMAGQPQSYSTSSTNYSNYAMPTQSQTTTPSQVPSALNTQTNQNVPQSLVSQAPNIQQQLPDYGNSNPPVGSSSTTPSSGTTIGTITLPSATGSATPQTQNKTPYQIAYGG